MIRSIFLGAAAATVIVSAAHAESWYVIEATAKGAIIMDADSRRTDGGTFLTERFVHPGVNMNKTPLIIASQFRDEFDCKGSRLKTQEFALIDLDGRVPPGLSRTDLPDNDWRPAEDGKPSGAFKRYACDGVLPPHARGPYTFVDIEAKYLMWLDDQSSELQGPRR